MPYRYYNNTLCGRWFDTLPQAVEDAIRAGQVRVGEENRLEWIDDGHIEHRSGDVIEEVRPACWPQED